MEIEWVRNEDIVGQKYSELRKGDVFTFGTTSCLALKLDEGHVLFDEVLIPESFRFCTGWTVRNNNVEYLGQLVKLGLA